MISTRDPMEFVRTKEPLYKELGWAKNPPARQKAIKTLAQHPELLVRPLVLKGNTLLVGYDEDGLKKLV
jgi:arsenate reductase